MKIVFASYVYSPEFNSPEAWLRRINIYSGILDALAKNHTIISIEQIDYEGDYIKNGVQYYFKKLNKVERRFPSRLHRFIKGLQPDVVFIHGLHFPWQVIQLRLGGKVKIMAQHHAEQPFNGFKKILQQLADRYINAYLFASRQMGINWVAKGNLASAQKIHEVMEVSSVFGPIDKQLALSKTGAYGSPIYLWVGRLEQNKDPITVVNAFLQFAKIQPLARLYMIYQTEELLSDIINLLDKHPEQSNGIKLVGKVEHEDLQYWFNSASFIISGSHYEGSGTVICEAMSGGCIPVITDIPSFRMLADNGGCGLLYKPGDQKELLQQLIKTTEMDIPFTSEQVIGHYNANLSFTAIAGRIEQIATSLCSS